MQKKEEIHLFILWNNGRFMEEKILNDMATKFSIMQTFNISWSEEMFSQNLSRLYGKKLHKSHKKKEKSGTGDLLLIVVKDKSPKLNEQGFNLNTMSAKGLYRQWTGGGHLVHASDSLDEAEENMLFLLGLSLKDFAEQFDDKKWSGKHQSFAKDLVGAPEWKDEKELKSFIKKIDGAQTRPVQDTLMVIYNDVYKLSRLLNATKKLFFMKRNLYQVPLKGSCKSIYIRKPIE